MPWRAFSTRGGRRKRGRDLTSAEVERAARTTSRQAKSKLGNKRWRKDDEGVDVGAGGEEGRSGSDCREGGEERRGEVRVRWREVGGRLTKESEEMRGRRASLLAASGGLAARGRSTIARREGSAKVVAQAGWLRWRASESGAAVFGDSFVCVRTKEVESGDAEQSAGLTKFKMHRNLRLHRLVPWVRLGVQLKVRQ